MRLGGAGALAENVVVNRQRTLTEAEAIGSDHPDERPQAGIAGDVEKQTEGHDQRGNDHAFTLANRSAFGYGFGASGAPRAAGMRTRKGPAARSASHFPAKPSTFRTGSRIAADRQTSP